MNLREISELRRRFRPERSAVSRVFGCYVNAGKEIVSTIDAPLGIANPEEQEMYLDLLRKVLSGSLGRNLVDVVFTTEQVAEGDDHRLLSDLRNTGLEDPEVREIFYRKVIDSLDLEGTGYLILLACDRYDVPRRRKDGENDDESDNVFTYIVCAVCPVKDPSLLLRYFHEKHEFHSSSTGQTVAPPVLGFLFPAFDDRAANLYNALYYVRKPAEFHQEFLDGVFGMDGPTMSAEEQREAFHNVLEQSLGGECGFDVLQTVHEQLLERIEQHREERNPEPLSVSPREVRDILESGGVSEERLNAFDLAVSEHFGENAALNPGNVIDTKRFEINTPEVRISVDPTCSYVVETRVIDGRKYLLIPAGHDVTVNGIPIKEYEQAQTAADIANVSAVEAAPEPAEVDSDSTPDGSVTETPEPLPDSTPDTDAPPW